MKITCPNCATRYDVDDARFVPDGRSVRCAECDESWFVPAPEPVEDLIPLKPRADARRRDEERAYDEASRPEKAEARRGYRDDAYDEPVDEPLFEAGPSSRGGARYGVETDEAAATRQQQQQDPARDRGPKRDSKGRFIRTAQEEEANRKAADEEERGRHAREDSRPAYRDDDRKVDRGSSRRESVGADQRDFDDRDELTPRERAGRSRGDRVDADFSSRTDHRGGAVRPDLRDDRIFSPAPRRGRPNEIVDADFEDLDDNGARYNDAEPGFGRRVREERRRATALARIEDLDPVAERVFNDEFFTALRVQPKELERAIRKARRRAEAREKNRLTPLRAAGWSALAGVVGFALFGAYVYRDHIVALAPNASGAYEAVGIEANPYGLRIEGVTHRVALSAEGPVIEILGRLKNETSAAVAPPMLEAEAVSASGDTLARWTFAARSASVRPGESADFATRAPAPEGVAEVLLSFAPVEGVKVSVGELLKPAAQ